MIVIKFKKLHEKAIVPTYKTAGAAGADLCIASFLSGRCIDQSTCRVYPGQILMVDTGIAMQIPMGYEGQVRPRSGLGSKGVTVINSPGTIDSDFEGAIKIALINLGDRYFDLSVGDRVAQLVISPVVHGVFIETDWLTETERGANGFGSTGVA